MRNNDIKDLQDYIKSRNLEEDPLVSKIMEVDIEQWYANFMYFKKLEGKYLKLATKDSLHYVFIKRIELSVNNKSDLKVIIDKADFKYTEFNYYFSRQLNYKLCTPYENRYDDYIEISESDYLHEIGNIQYDCKLQCYLKWYGKDKKYY